MEQLVRCMYEELFCFVLLEILRVDLHCTFEDMCEDVIMLH